MSLGDIDRFSRNDLPKGIALDECRRAALEVMKVWPDETVTREALSTRAAEYLHTDGRDGTMARYVLRDLIAQCKSRPVICRSENFWLIMHALFGHNDALVLYLEQCRSLTSRRQRRAIIEHLQKWGYTKRQINAAKKQLRKS